MINGKARMSQMMMRLRVVAQGATLAVLIFGSASAGIDFQKKATTKNPPKLLDV